MSFRAEPQAGAQRGSHKHLSIPEALEPGLVSPAVLYMCSDDAPNGEVIQAVNGKFSRCAVFSNDGVDLGGEAAYEDLVEHVEALRDMGAAHEGRVRRGN